MVPLVDDGEFHQQDEGGQNVVEVVLAVVELSEGGSVEEKVPTEEPGRLLRTFTKILDLPFEQLHPHHGKGVVHHLEQEEEWRREKEERGEGEWRSRRRREESGLTSPGVEP